MEISSEKLKAMSLGIGIVGTVGLLIWSLVTAPMEIQIEDISKQHIGRKVEVSGLVNKIHSGQKFVRFLLQQQGNIPIVIFDPDLQARVLLEKKRLVRVSGTVTEYKGNLEIIAEEVELVD
tara:strand:+ start:86 stop:448 length:363 start_codon:yes stop_codon:yes gene_type:complete